MSGENILEVQNLTKHFKISGKQIVHAVDGVSFTLQKGKHSDWSARADAENRPVRARLSGCTM